ncbi:MAG: SDR family oxidoreductase [Chloroflexi bacterium]|nr:SDR family oxidoreductase [Chloroflexota bacterium]
MGNILDLNGKVALISGAGQGVGRQIALHMASYGAAGVIVNDFYAERAEAVAKEVRELGGKALAAQGDVGDFDGVAKMVEAGLKEFGSIDVLVNNAGNMGPNPDVTRSYFVDSTPEGWKPWLNVNMYGVLNCTRHVLPSMIANRRGSIITIISDAGRYGDQNSEVYAFAKAGAAGFTRSVARTNGRFGIRANSVAIAATRTPTTAAAFESEGNMQKILRQYPVGRIGEPTDVANMVLFLASDASSWVTGQTYPVNGGFTFGL